MREFAERGNTPEECAKMRASAVTSGAGAACDNSRIYFAD
jgi:hypothetical protein